MKNITLAIIFIFTSLLAVSCLTGKRTLNNEQKVSVSYAATTAERDSLSLNWQVDTSSYCEQVLSLERVEYYPTIYTDSAGNVKQMVKSVTRTNNKRTAETKKKEEIQSVNVIADTMQVVADSANITKSHSEQTKHKPSGSVWWWVLLVLVVLGLHIHLRNKVF